MTLKTKTKLTREDFEPVELDLRPSIVSPRFVAQEWQAEHPGKRAVLHILYNRRAGIRGEVSAESTQFVTGKRVYPSRSRTGFCAVCGSFSHDLTYSFDRGLVYVCPYCYHKGV